MRSEGRAARGATEVRRGRPWRNWEAGRQAGKAGRRAGKRAGRTRAGGLVGRRAGQLLTRLQQDARREHGCLGHERPLHSTPHLHRKQDHFLMAQQLRTATQNSDTSGRRRWAAAGGSTHSGGWGRGQGQDLMVEDG